MTSFFIKLVPISILVFLSNYYFWGYSLNQTYFVSIAEIGIFGIFTIYKHGAKYISMFIIYWLIMVIVSYFTLQYMGEFSIEINNTITVVSSNNDLLPGDTYLEKFGYLMLGMFFAFLLGLLKPFQNSMLHGILIIISIPISGYYVYTIEGLSFMSFVYTIGFCIYALFTITMMTIFTEDNKEKETTTYPTPEPAPVQEPDPIPAPKPIIEEPKDVYVTCVNCNTEHKNPENDLCNKCTKNMHKLDTNIKCSNCGGEYESDEISCPYCGQN